MRLSFPVTSDNSLDSELYGNFCDAPGYIIYDTETEEVKFIKNMCPVEEHEGCNAIDVFGGEKVDVIIINGISPDALKNLQNAGIQAIRAGIGNVKENIELFKSGSLICLTVNLTCGSKNVSCMCDCVS